MHGVSHPSDYSKPLAAAPVPKDKGPAARPSAGEQELFSGTVLSTSLALQSVRLPTVRFHLFCAQSLLLYVHQLCALTYTEFLFCSYSCTACALSLLLHTYLVL